MASLALSPRPRLVATVLALGMVACASTEEVEEAEMGEGALGAPQAGGSSRVKLTCDGYQVFDSEDKGAPLQGFDVVLPSATAIQFTAARVGFTVNVTAVLPEYDREASTHFGRPDAPALANLSAEPVVYRVRVVIPERVTGDAIARDAFRITCYPVVSAPAVSGREDRAMCMANEVCRGSFGTEEGTCSAVQSLDGPASVGFCEAR